MARQFFDQTDCRDIIPRFYPDAGFESVNDVDSELEDSIEDDDGDEPVIKHDYQDSDRDSSEYQYEGIDPATEQQDQDSDSDISNDSNHSNDSDNSGDNDQTEQEDQEYESDASRTLAAEEDIRGRDWTADPLDESDVEDTSRSASEHSVVGSSRGHPDSGQYIRDISTGSPLPAMYLTGYERVEQLPTDFGYGFSPQYFVQCSPTHDELSSGNYNQGRSEYAMDRSGYHMESAALQNTQYPYAPASNYLSYAGNPETSFYSEQPSLEPMRNQGVEGYYTDLYGNYNSRGNIHSEALHDSHNSFHDSGPYPSQNTFVHHSENTRTLQGHGYSLFFQANNNRSQDFSPNPEEFPSSMAIGRESTPDRNSDNASPSNVHSSQPGFDSSMTLGREPSSDPPQS